MKNELQLFIPGAKITNCVPVLLFHSPEKKGNLLISLLAMGGNMFLLSEKSIITLGLQRHGLVDILVSLINLNISYTKYISKQSF